MSSNAVKRIGEVKFIIIIIIIIIMIIIIIIIIFIFLFYFFEIIIFFSPFSTEPEAWKLD